MKKSRYTPEQVAFDLRQAEEGTPVSEVRRLRALEEENRKLRQMICPIHVLRFVLDG